MKGLWLKTLRKYVHPRVLAYMCVVGAFLVHLTLGSIYTYGNLVPYLFAYMNTSTPSRGNITVGSTMWIFGLAVFGLGASISLGGFIETKLGPISTSLIGSFIMSFGVIITAETIKVHLVLISISYGLLAGIGSGIAYGVTLAIPNEWFPHAKGLINGIIVAGFGLGSMSFDFLQSLYISPNGTHVYLVNPSRVPSSFIIFGSAYVVIQMIGSIMITHPEECEEESVLKKRNLVSDMFSDDLLLSNEVNIRPHELIYERDFWILWITYALNSVVAILILMLHKTFGQSLCIKDNKLVMASAIGSFCNGIGRILWGYFNDKVSYKVLMTILSTTMCVMLGTFYLCNVLVGDTQFVFYICWVIILHLLLSGNFALFPTICIKSFGLKNFAWNYGMLFTAYSFSGILTSSLTMSLIQKNEPTTYLPPFLIGSGLSLLSALITIFYRGYSLLYRNLKM